MSLDQDENLTRFVEAVALGHIADIEFAEEAHRLGIDALDGSPLDAIAEHEKPFVFGRPNG